MLFSLLINFTLFRGTRGVGEVKLFSYDMPFYSELYVSVAFELTSNLLSYFRNVITFSFSQLLLFVNNFHLAHFYRLLTLLADEDGRSKRSKWRQFSKHDVINT